MTLNPEPQSSHEIDLPEPCLLVLVRESKPVCGGVWRVHLVPGFRGLVGICLGRQSAPQKGLGLRV